MKLLSRLLPIAFIIFYSSCATKKKMTREESLKAREEWLKFSHKEYPNLSKEQIIAGAEEVLNLADGDDFKFFHTEDGFIAKRIWFIYAVLAAEQGTDTWKFSVKKNEKGINVATFYVTRTSGTISGTVTGSGDTTTMTLPSQDDIIQGTAIYEIFWNRMDYVLGMSTSWPDCNLYKKKITENKVTGELTQICDSVTLDDKLPMNLNDEELIRIFKNDKFKIRDYKRKQNTESTP